MRRTLIGTAVAVAAALGPVAATTPPAVAKSKPAAPTSAQIRTAVGRAERSKYLWATVNVCTSKRPGGLLGVRGEMPALGFASTLSMTVSLNQYSTAHRGFVAVPGATAKRTVSLGSFSSHVHQGGAEFPFSANPGVLDATVTFTWTRGSTRIGRVSRTTRGGHPGADFSSPPHFSAAQCKLG